MIGMPVRVPFESDTTVELKNSWLQKASPSLRLVIASSWLAPDSWAEMQEQQIRTAIDDGLDWDEFVRLVDRHGTTTLSWAVLSKQRKVEIPGTAKQQLKVHSDANRIEAMKQSFLLVEALRALNQVNVAVMPLKGQILSFDLYGDVGLRRSKDLDLMVASDDLSKARVCLERVGWSLDSSSWIDLTPRQWESFIRHEYHISFIHDKNCKLELHWRDPWETLEMTNARWARSTRTVWQGCFIQTMCAGDKTLYLCNHGGNHAWYRVKWLGDLARAHTIGQLNWREAMLEGRKNGHEPALLAALGLLNHVYEFPLLDVQSDRPLNPKSPLIEIPLEALAEPDELPPAHTLAAVRNGLRLLRYDRLLRPRKAWFASISELFYRRGDFKLIRLPDSLFWVYKPLRPVLWIWGWIRRVAVLRKLSV
jgi:hypothetical protein